MSSAESGPADALKALARRDAGATAPYGYEEFVQRERRTQTRQRTLGWASAASVALVAVLVGLGLRNSQPPPAHERVEALLRTAATAPAGEPALVEVDRYMLRSDLEDRIAWFDAALSAGHAEALPDQDLMRLEATREQLARSLQQVSYAHAVLDF